jgi:hypothetical protein
MTIERLVKLKDLLDKSDGKIEGIKLFIDIESEKPSTESFLFTSKSKAIHKLNISERANQRIMKAFKMALRELHNYYNTI